MSRITAPDGEVTTPITPGRNGSGRLREAANRPSDSSSALRFSSIAISAPTPAGRMSSTLSWYFDCGPKVVIRPVAITSIPSSGRTVRRAAWPFQVTQAITERSSLRSK